MIFFGLLASIIFLLAILGLIASGDEMKKLCDKRIEELKKLGEWNVNKKIRYIQISNKIFYTDYITNIDYDGKYGNIHIYETIFFSTNFYVLPCNAITFNEIFKLFQNNWINNDK